MLLNQDEVNVQHHDGNGLTFPRGSPDQPIQPGGTPGRRRRGGRRQSLPGQNQETYERVHGLVPGPAEENGTGEPQDAQLGDQQAAGRRVEADDRGGEETVHRRGEAAPGHAHEGTPGLQVPATEEDQDAAEEGQVLACRRAARLLWGCRDGRRAAAGEPRRGPRRGKCELRHTHERLGKRHVLGPGGGCSGCGSRDDAGGAAGVHATPGHRGSPASPASAPSPASPPAQPAARAQVRHERLILQPHLKLSELHERLAAGLRRPHRLHSPAPKLRCLPGVRDDRRDFGVPREI